VRRGEIQERWDVNYISASLQFEKEFSNPRYSLITLRELVSFVQYGISAIATEEPIGVPILRMNNLQNDGWDLSNLKYIELLPEELDKYKIVQGDILFNRTNSKELVGKCEVFKEEGDWVFASYLIRVRLDLSKALPEFISAFLSTKAGRLQIDRVSRQIIGMSNVNAEELKDLLIPIPSLNTQRALVADMESARLARQAKLSQADELLKGIDGFVLGQLGIKLPKENTRKSFATRLKQLQTNLTMNADYFHPERMEALKVIQKSSPRLRVERLADIADFLRDIATVQEDDNYLGLASVQSNTGELVQVEETADGQCFRYQKNDVLFGRLRPYLNKVRCAEEDGVCSTEFHVIRLRKEEKSKEEISSEYLAVILRSSVILAQTKHMMTGNTHPRLTNEDVVSLVVPIPKDINLQKKIVSELQRRRAQARALRESAEREWQKAKEKFEKALLG
jgi:restriction endonuclease S subunit